MGHPHVSPVGRTGRLVTATRGEDGPGEVLVAIRGGTETFLARSAAPLSRGQTVLCVEEIGHRSVFVEPWAEPSV